MWTGLNRRFWEKKYLIQKLRILKLTFSFSSLLLNIKIG